MIKLMKVLLRHIINNHDFAQTIIVKILLRYTTIYSAIFVVFRCTPLRHHKFWMKVWMSGVAHRPEVTGRSSSPFTSFGNLQKRQEKLHLYRMLVSYSRFEFSIPKNKVWKFHAYIQKCMRTFHKFTKLIVVATLRAT